MNYFVFLPFVVNEPVVTECLKNIDIPKDKLVLIDNSIDSFGEKYEKEGYRVIYYPENIGCAGGWNVGLKFGLKRGADMIIMINPVEKFTGGFKKQVIDRLSEANEYGFASNVNYHCRGFTPKLIEAVGFFDENFYPVYCEDVDYERRMRLLGIHLPQINFEFTRDDLLSSVEHGIVWNPKSSHEYYNLKWGGGFKVVGCNITNEYVGDESFNSYFNLNVPVWWWDKLSLDVIKSFNGGRDAGLTKEWINRLIKELPLHEVHEVVRDRYWNSMGATVKRIKVKDKFYYLYTWLSRIMYELFKEADLIINDGCGVNVQYFDKVHSMMVEELSVLQTWIIGRSSSERFWMGWRIINRLREAYFKGLTLTDVSTYNILLKGDELFFIDLSEAVIGVNHVPFSESTSIKGTRPDYWGGFNFNGARGLRCELGFSYDDYGLVDELIGCDSVVYETYHLNNFTYLDGKRDSIERCNIILNNKSVSGVNILDLGSSCGGIGFELLNRGAASVTFVELIEVKCEFINKLLSVINKNQILSKSKVINSDVNDLIPEDFKGFDVITCLALTGWVKDVNKLSECLNSSGCPLIICEPNYGDGDELVMLNLPNYGVRSVGKDSSGGEYYWYEIRSTT